MNSLSEPPPHQLRRLSVKELAVAMGRHESYVWAMRRRGFNMVGGRGTLSSAESFLKRVKKPWGKLTERNRTESNNSAHT